MTRKGAIRAGRGELGIIPGSMGTKSYIVRGLGNPASFESASHGAGRRMSRTEARKRFTVRDLEGADRRRRVPQGPRRHRRGAQGLQEHRPRHGAAARPGRDRRRAEADRVREGLKSSGGVNWRHARAAGGRTSGGGPRRPTMRPRSGLEQRPDDVDARAPAGTTRPAARARRRYPEDDWRWGDRHGGRVLHDACARTRFGWPQMPARTCAAHRWSIFT